MVSTRKLGRENVSLLRPLEQRAINWLLPHYPSWITPDVLSYTSLLTGPIMFIMYFFSQRNPALLWGASALLIINWLADSTDGRLAAYRKKERPNYGHYIDHVFDVVVTMCLGLGLGYSPVLRIPTGLSVVFLFYLWMLHSSIRSAVTRVYQLTYFMIGPTELRLLILIGQTYWLLNPTEMSNGIPVVEYAARAFVAAGMLLLIYESVKTIIKLKIKDEAKLAQNSKV